MLSTCRLELPAIWSVSRTYLRVKSASHTVTPSARTAAPACSHAGVTTGVATSGTQVMSDAGQTLRGAQERGWRRRCPAVRGTPGAHLHERLYARRERSLDGNRGAARGRPTTAEPASATHSPHRRRSRAAAVTRSAGQASPA